MRKKFFNYGIRVAIIYWLVSFVWIFFSDKILQNLIHDFDKITHMQTIKGVGFISISALLIYYLILFYQKRQKTIENKIIENEERLRLLVDSSMDAILLTVPQGKILSANPAAERIFGKTEKEIISQGRDGITDLTDPRLEVAIQQRTEKGYFVGELNFVRADGSIFPGDVSTKVYTDSEGNLRTSMIIRDISERKWLEKELEETNLQLKNTLESMSDALVTLDRNWKITDVNPRAAEINKKTIKEFLGIFFWEEWPALLNTPFENLVRKAMSERVTSQTELHYYIEGQYDAWLDVHI